MQTTLTCPHCGKPVELTEALTHQIEAQVLAAEKDKHQKELEQARVAATAQVQKELALVKEEAAKKEKQLVEAQAMELALRKEKNALAEEKRTFELEKQRQLDVEREKIRAKTAQEILEQQRMKEKEKDKVIEDLKKALEDAQRKASQGSQQLQGEVQELDLEEMLRTNFATDSIEPIGKGVLGADIRQVVKSPRGVVCGSILWESKRTRAWSDGWVTKLKEDMRNDKANIPAIVTETMPQEIKGGMGLKDGVWVALPTLVLPLATLLRKALLDAARQKMISENKQSRAEELYGYVTSHEFAQQVEGMIEVYLDMKRQIESERRSFEKSWAMREKQVNRLLSGVSGMYGNMQGIAGSALPPIKTLELESAEDE